MNPSFLTVLAGLMIGNPPGPGAPVTKPDPRPLNPHIVQMLGIGTGFADTLSQVAGWPANVDTLPTLMRRDLTELGTYIQPTTQRDEGAILVHPDATAYRPIAGHPAHLATPSGVLAHEFGHYLQAKTVRENLKANRRPLLPEFMNQEPEQFADKFANAILALRDTSLEVPADSTLMQFIKNKLKNKH